MEIKMTAKQELNEIKSIYHEVVMLNQQRSELREQAFSLKSVSGILSPDKVQTSLDGDRFAEIFASIDETERNLVERLKVLDEKKSHVMRKINAMPDHRYKTLLYDKYVLFMSWEEIAHIMRYSLRRVFQLHSEALNLYETLH